VDWSEVGHHYLELITDPAHTLVETTFIAAELIIGSVIWAKLLKPRWERMLEVWHHRIDKEHGFEHTSESDQGDS